MTMSTHEGGPAMIYDMDHLLHQDGRIFRTLGNFTMANGQVLAYNLYSPDAQGDRTFRGEPYTKRYVEDTTLPADVLDTYDLVSRDEVVEYFDPIEAARGVSDAYQGTVWGKLYDAMVDIFGKENIGIFGSALPGDGLHLTPDGQIKNDVDFFIEGLDNVPLLASSLPEVREALGFTDYTDASQDQIVRTWSKVFRSPNNSLAEIMKRRWSGMQLDDNGRVVLNTFRFRDKSVLTPPELLAPENIVSRNVQVSGTAVNTEGGNLYPRTFTIEDGDRQYPVYSFWWKFSSPVKEEDTVSVRGDLMSVDGQDVIRLTNYEDHSIQL